jgi:pimeloyl-ACP methyl ester carboxylesterase
MVPDGTKSFFFKGSGGVKLHCVEKGEGPAMVFLHGFPEFWWSWRYQLDHFSHRYRVFAPDMRGYNRSDAPADVSAYRAGTIVKDVVSLIQTIQRGERSRREDTSIVLVGHDLGGAIAWLTAMYYPELVRKLVVLSFPHPVVGREHFNHMYQRIRSYYMYLLSLPWVPEFVLSINPEFFYSRLFRNDTCVPEAFPDKVIQKYVEAQRQVGSMHGPLNYHRNLLSDGWSGFDHPPTDPLSMPVMLMWGEKDAYAHPRTMNEHGLEAHVNANYRVEILPETSHWMQQERPKIVNQMMDEFLGNP